MTDKTMFTMHVNEPVLDSMCYDSGTSICFYGTNDEYVEVAVQGYVGVFYKGEKYCHFSDMPEELQKMFIKGQWKKLDQVAHIDENNWFEIFYVKNGECLYSDVVEMGTPLSEKELKECCKECLKDYKKL